MENKTLIGKNGFLFLINDSSNEILCHKNGIDSSIPNIKGRYSKYKDKFFMLVYPDKSYCCQEYLPDEYRPLIYRKSFDEYKKYLNDNILDGYEYIKEDSPKYYYKTDTHMNLLGTYMLLTKFIEFLNSKLELNMKVENIEIEEIFCNNGVLNLGKGIGDLRYPQNLGNQIVEDISDTYYTNISSGDFYISKNIGYDEKIRFLELENKILVDKNNEINGTMIGWNVVNKYVIYKNNLESETNKKILIFYDSFTLNLIPLLLNISSEVYMMKQTFNPILIEIINPDLIFELRVERFL